VLAPVVPVGTATPAASMLLRLTVLEELVLVDEELDDLLLDDVDEARLSALVVVACL
jgi:precorrin-6B methylase 1